MSPDVRAVTHTDIPAVQDVERATGSAPESSRPHGRDSHKLWLTALSAHDCCHVDGEIVESHRPAGGTSAPASNASNPRSVAERGQRVL
jgi:hypothetical protein